MGPPSEKPTIAAPGPGGIHHGADIVHPCLEIRDPGGAVRHPDAALVEQDQASERRHLAKEIGGAALPWRTEVRHHPAADENHIYRTITDHAVSNVNVTAAGVPDLWGLHMRSLLQSQPRDKVRALPSYTTVSQVRPRRPPGRRTGSTGSSARPRARRGTARGLPAPGAVR